jgi:DNA replication and repair protein RecF
MFIKSIQLIGFRNYVEAFIEFDKQKTIIIGKNAQGKTNLLELIQILSIGKSKRAHRDADLVNFEHPESIDHAVIRAEASTARVPDLQIALMIRKSGKRALKINDLKVSNSDLLHHLYSVSFMVDDLEIIGGSPSSRRAWIDAVLTQLSQSYGLDLAKFEKILSQRNSFLKKLAEAGITLRYMSEAQREELASWDSLFIASANTVISERRLILSAIEPVAAKYYASIAGHDTGPRALALNYLGEDLTQEAVEASLPKDLARAYSGLGPQRHDLEFTLNRKDSSLFASQGERRSIILALKLAELDLLKNKYNDNPILLLDDVLAELDEDRQDFLLNAVSDEVQVLITTTHLGKHLEKWSRNAQILEIDQGNIYKTCYDSNKALGNESLQIL